MDILGELPGKRQIQANRKNTHYDDQFYKTKRPRVITELLRFIHTSIYKYSNKYGKNA